MTMFTNAWARLTETKAQEWLAWGTWLANGREGPEPGLDSFGKSMIARIVDPNFAFYVFKTAEIESTQWRMGSLYGVTEAQLQTGYSAYPGEWDVVGYWTWKSDDAQSAIDGAFSFKWADALLFMPDVCADPPDCTSMVPATKVTDVNLLAGQPPRELSLEMRVL